MNVISIWAPKYSTSEVLVAGSKVRPGLNKVVFTKAKQVDLYMDGAKMKSYPKVSNGKIYCHAIPLGDFDENPGV